MIEKFGDIFSHGFTQIGFIDIFVDFKVEKFYAKGEAAFGGFAAALRQLNICTTNYPEFKENLPLQNLTSAQ